MIMSPEDLYHTGIIVPDVGAAAARLTASAGYRWTKPLEHTIAVHTPDGELDVPMRLVYSVQAPHLELVQEVPGTLWSRTPAGAAHHVGYWADDIAATSAELERAGFPLEVRPTVPGSFAYHRAPDGLRIEIVQRAMFGDWPAFLEAFAA